MSKPTVIYNENVSPRTKTSPKKQRENARYLQEALVRFGIQPYTVPVRFYWLLAHPASAYYLKSEADA